MLKTLIVDDEPLVREGLKNIIAWEEYNFSICGEGKDGKDGLNKIIEQKPDLVLMDVKMPGLYGIDVIRQVREMGYGCKFIILTGYSDFQYAKNAIDVGVESYLLKPIDEDELIEAIKKIGKEIEEEQKIKKHVENSERYMKQNTIRDILLNVGSIERAKDIFRDEYKKYQVVILDLRDSIKDRDKINNEIIKLAESVFREPNNIDMLIVDSKVCILFVNKENNVVNNMLEQLYKCVKIKLDEEVFIAVGNVEESYANICNSYQKARMLIDKKFIFIGKAHIVLTDEIRFNEKFENNFNIDKFNRELSAYVEINDTERIEMMLRRIEQHFMETNYSIEKIKSICVNTFISLKYSTINNYDEVGQYFPKNSYVIQQIHEMDSLGSIIEYLMKEFTYIGSKICNNSSENVMKRILSYIEKNYYKDLKLETLAEIFNYNSAYLGKIFKSYTNENFNTYVDKIRIENAKKLLLENKLKVYKISEKVGYKNTDYFYGKFKKYVGISPKEFSKRSGIAIG